MAPVPIVTMKKPIENKHFIEHHEVLWESLQSNSGACSPSSSIAFSDPKNKKVGPAQVLVNSNTKSYVELPFSGWTASPPDGPEKSESWPGPIPHQFYYKIFCGIWFWGLACLPPRTDPKMRKDGPGQCCINFNTNPFEKLLGRP